MELEKIKQGPFEADWDSLRTYECPKWFRDAKLGIWAHWGPQSVPMYGDWYARHMYVEGHDQNLFHRRIYGHPSKFGYKDIVKLWKAEKFDPDALMDLYVKAGAKYFVAQAVHHDNFDTWDSKHNPWNATKVGPEKNIMQMWQDAARNKNLRFGVTEHLGATFKWWACNKGADKEGGYAGIPYDGNDPAFESLYLPNQGEVKEGWYTANPWWHEHWYKRMKDLVDQHQPDLLYSDGPLPFNKPDVDLHCPEVGLNIVAHLYNTSVKNNGGVNQAVYNQKDTNQEVYSIGVLDIERGMQADIAKEPWQTDTCVGGWFYNVRRKYKTPKHVIEMLVNIASKNGNLLLNFTQKPDGSLDDECLHILDRMAAWVAVNGEGIYDTRPWNIAGEGPNLIPKESGKFKEDKGHWVPEDYRFTAKDDAIYAFQFEWPEDGKALIRSFASDCVPKVTSVELLGVGPVEFMQTPYGLGVQLPENSPVDYCHCIKVQMG